MSTRATIEIRDPYGGRYKIYRHYDGYPDAVLGDIRKALEILGTSSISDAEYFLANFIFLAKWNFWKQGLYWEGGYGVCSPTCEHGDLNFEYLIWWQDGKWYIQIRRYWKDEDETATTIYRGELEKAFELFISEFKDGCHIRESP